MKRLRMNSTYYCILTSHSGIPEVVQQTEKNSDFDDLLFKLGNYYETKEEAENMCEIFKIILKGE